MDLAQYELLETHIIRLIQAYERVKTENNRLGQQVHHLQHTVSSQQQELERLQREHDELLPLRAKMNVLQQEREIIQQKLQQMLSTIEWLEERTRIEGDAQRPQPTSD
jgi:predicted RNase H-like nuclease (RuvC/YqgF family)